MQTASSSDTSARKRVLDILAHAPSASLAALWDGWADKPAFTKVRGPETGLVMVRGRAGGGGAPFNLGEATVSRASVRIVTGEVGHGYCLGRDLAKAEVIAVIDALWQREGEAVEAQIVTPLQALAAQAEQKKRGETAATKVDFFTMVRGDN
ncbi:phosphonate C-P lyase system protein PhnG [Devosia sp. 2618]|uniref:phosphonate C-P lyase system protein PhnG n=1 Tax=Devosia sp. 2618 TaxID=3156454 RepID=UPI003396F7DC